MTKRFRSGDAELVVFRDLDLDVLPGERLALTGESGTGKTTLLYLLGLLDRPTEGRIWFGERDVTGLDGSALAEVRNREIGFVWQMNTLLQEFTALENVMMPLLIRGVASEEAALDAQSRLQEVGLGARATHRAGELSGGEQQRVALARALAGKPRLLLADEPTGNLDEKTGERIIELMEQVHEKHGLTTVYVTHNSSFAERAHRILELKEGALAVRRAD